MKIFFLCLGLISCNFSFASRCGPSSCSYHSSCKSNDCPVCYTSPVYHLQCDWGLYLKADYLYWIGKDSNLVYLQKTKGIRVIELENDFQLPVFANLPKKSKRLGGKWKSGFRIGIGKNFSCDGWDVLVDWTYFRTKNNAKKSIAPFQIGIPNDFLLSPWTNPLFGTDLDFDTSGIAFFGFVPIYTKINTKWKERINIIDFEIGRNYWLSPFLAMRPYLGAKGGWDRNSLIAKNFLESTNGLISSDKVHFRNRFWGCGILAGFKPTWNICSGFSLFGNADMAILWGRFRNKRTEDIVNRFITLPSSPFEVPKMRDKFTSFQAILDLAAGLRFDSTFCHNRFYIALDVGWEQHYWFNHFCYYKFRGGLGGLSRSSGFTELNFITSDFDEVYGDFIFGGLYASIRFDF